MSSQKAPQKHPFSAIPVARSSAPILKIKLYLVLGALGLAALLGPLGFALAASKSGSTGPVTATVDYSASGYARIVAEDYLSGRETSVPVADGVDPAFAGAVSAEEREPLPWSGLTLVSSEAAEDVASQQSYEVSKFVFMLDGKPMKLDVTMLQTPDGPVLGALPSFRTADLSHQKYDGVDYEGSVNFKSGPPANAEVAVAVKKWLEAYASSDGARLKELVGDPRAEATYTGLGGFEVVGEPEIRFHVLESPDAVRTVAGVAPTAPMYVRVRALLRSTSANEYSVSSDFELLLFATDVAQPKVVAWGAPGTAPLVPFSNSNRH